MKYNPSFNPHTGSINGTIFFLQVLYWHEKMGKPFYKFQNINSHVLYKPGTSWVEELGFSISQLKSVLSNTSTKLKKGELYDLSKCKLVLYWSAGNGVNYYCSNFAAMLTLGHATIFLENQYPHFAKWKNDFSKVGKDLFKVTFSHPQKFNFSISYLQKITQSNTIKYPEKDTTPFIFCNKKNSILVSGEVLLPFGSEKFEEAWQAWKDYRASEHQFVFSEKNEQAALMPLADYNEEFAVYLIRTAIANGWKNFHFEDTPNKFLKFKNPESDARATTTEGGKFEPHVAKIFAKYTG